MQPKGSQSTTGTPHLVLLCPPHPPHTHTHPIPTLKNSEKEKEAKVESYILRSLLSWYLLREAFSNQPSFLNTHSSSLYPCRFILVLISDLPECILLIYLLANSLCIPPECRFYEERVLVRLAHG